MEKWLNSSPSQGDIHGFESRWGHHTDENTPVYWTKNWYDIRGAFIIKIARFKFTRLFLLLNSMFFRNPDMPSWGFHTRTTFKE